MAFSVFAMKRLESLCSRMVHSSILFVLVAVSATAGHNLVDEPITWLGGNVAMPCSVTNNMLRKSGQYTPENIIATKVLTHNREVFVLTPRFKPGVPATVSKLTTLTKSWEPKLVPFPDLANHEEGNSNAIQNAVDFHIDVKGIMWILDSGRVETMEDSRMVTHPAIFALNAVTGEIVHKIDLAPLVEVGSVLQYIVADYASGESPYVYISDAGNAAILVYDVNKDSGFRVMLPETVSEGRAFQDVLYLTIAKPPLEGATIYFTYLGAPNLFSIKTDHLRNGKASGKMIDLGVKPSRMVFLGSDLSSNVYFRNEGENTIYSWDTKEPLRNHAVKVLLKDDGTGLRATSVCFDKLKFGVRILESNFIDFADRSSAGGAYQRLRLEKKF